MGYSVGSELMDIVGLALTDDKLVNTAAGSILADALIACREGRACSVSLNKNFYNGLTRYNDALRYRVVRPTLLRLEGLGLLEVEKGKTWAEGGKGRQTRFWAAAPLLDLARRHPLLQRRKPREVIVLKDGDKNLIEYRDTEQTDRWRRETLAQTEAIQSVDVRVSAPDVVWVDADFVIIPDAVKHGDRKGAPVVIRSDASDLYRSFNNSSFRHGGRSYGHWVQRLNKERRAQVTIDGRPVDLLDYGASHIGILYAAAGVPLDGDPYDIPGFERGDVKLGLLIAINAETDVAARKALAAKFTDEAHPRKDHLAKAASIIEAIKDRHYPIAGSFCSGAGIGLQFEEAQVLGDVMKLARKEGIVCLPVHDEIVVAAGRDASIVQDLMVQSWATRFGTFPVV